MGECPVVSVVVPLFNKRESIGRTIESILHQTVRNIEILVVDDGSTDGSGEIVEAVRDPRVRLLRQTNTGPNQARNNAVRVARSDLVAFIDADDEWTPEHLQNILETRRRYPKSGVYATSFCWVEEDGSKRYPEFTGLDPHGDFCVVENYFAVSRISSITTCSSVAMTKDVYEEIGGFPASEFVKQGHPVWVRIGLNYPIGFCKQPSMIYHLDAENRWDGHIRKIKSHLKDCDSVLLAILDQALVRHDYRNPHVSRDDIRRYRRKVLFWRASDLLRIGQHRKGAMAALRSLFTPGYSVRTLKLLVKHLRAW